MILMPKGMIHIETPDGFKKDDYESAVAKLKILYPTYTFRLVRRRGHYEIFAREKKR